MKGCEEIHPVEVTENDWGNTYRNARFDKIEKDLEICFPNMPHESV